MQTLLLLLALLCLPSCANNLAAYTDGQGGRYVAQVGSALTRSKASHGQASSVVITKPNGDRIELNVREQGETDGTHVPTMAGYMSAGNTALKSLPSIAKAVQK